MIGKSELRKLVKSKLADLQKTRPDDLFTPEDVKEYIQEKTGHVAAPSEIDEILFEQWGSGIEAGTVGARLWRFGAGTPPVSQEIRTR